MNLLNIKEESEYEARLEVDRLDAGSIGTAALFRVSLDGQGASIVLTPNQVSTLVDILKSYILTK